MLRVRPCGEDLTRTRGLGDERAGGQDARLRCESRSESCCAGPGQRHNRQRPRTRTGRSRPFKASGFGPLTTSRRRSRAPDRRADLEDAVTSPPRPVEASVSTRCRNRPRVTRPSSRRPSDLRPGAAGSQRVLDTLDGNRPPSTSSRTMDTVGAAHPGGLRFSAPCRQSPRAAVAMHSTPSVRRDLGNRSDDTTRRATAGATQLHPRLREPCIPTTRG